MSTAASNALVRPHSFNDSRVFWGCFIALVTCAFGFAVRTQVIGDWAREFVLSETEKGAILGVGFWPFAFSIFALSFVVDKIGYGRTAALGFVLHAVSTVMLVTAKNASMLYWGTFLFALSNGTVEAYINAAVASMYSREKTKWLNILHAGWPVGMAVAGALAIIMGGMDVDWRWKVALTLVPTAIYPLVLLGTKFPISERVAAGVTYRQMLADFGALGAFVGSYLISLQVMDIWFKEHNAFVWSLAPALVVALIFGIGVRSLGRPLYFFLLIIMLPLATTELGVDSWITDLMNWILSGDLVAKWGMDPATAARAGGWVFVYTVSIMAVLRFFAGPIVHRLSPLGLLAVCALLAILGLAALSKSTTLATVFLAATLYGVGKTFFWPTMLGVVAEKCPKGGALTLNSIGGVGMLGLGVGGVFLGFIQDTAIDKGLAQDSAMHAKYVTVEKPSILGKYKAVNRQNTDDAIALYDYKQAFIANPDNRGKNLEVDPHYLRMLDDALGHVKPADGAPEAEKALWRKAKDADKVTAKEAYLVGKGLIVDKETYAKLTEERKTLDNVTTKAKQGALLKAAALPTFMLVGYLILIGYFAATGGYKPTHLHDELGEPVASEL